MVICKEKKMFEAADSPERNIKCPDIYALFSAFPSVTAYLRTNRL